MAVSGEGGSNRSKLEFAVQMSCQSCVDAIQRSLQGIPGIQVNDVNLTSETVVLETTLTVSEVQALLESTGRRAVLKGMGNTAEDNLGAAVALISGAGMIQGVVHFLQLSEKKCLIDGVIDGLSPGKHGFHVHEFGDLTEECFRCGMHFDTEGSLHGGPEDAVRHAGDLGNVEAGADGRAVFRMENSHLKVGDIIGRSLVVDEKEDDLGHGGHPLSKITGNSGERLACGIIARSAGLYQNPKQICTCDGVTLWEERDLPIAGPGRRASTQPSANL
uniref:Superoxide dismutase copper chaperone n=1 Tax=Geotrypetes seraphini TaxID=260995 RepID=A0A6P8RZ80_GEOSA|nr:copper chaperone for superoxide dismutase [Geotrypetes seraphini]